MTDRPHDEEPTGVEQVPDTPRERRLELLVAFLLGFAALLSAWSAYQATTFGGDQSSSFRIASDLKLDSAQADNRAGRATIIDVTTFQQWLDAATEGKQVLAERIRRRFRGEMATAFDAWIATDPLNDPGAPSTPFAMPEYRVAAAAQAERLEKRAEEVASEGERADEVAGRYVLTVVLFGIALFLLGVQSRIGVFRLRAALVAGAGAIVAGTFIWVLTLPRLLS